MAARPYIIEASVIVKGLRDPSLSFFSTQKFKLGTVVFVPYRKTSRAALVMDVRTVRTARTEIREASYSLKKVSVKNSQKPFSPEFVRTLSWLADYYATSPGEVLLSLFPPRLLEKLEYVTDISKRPSSNTSEKKQKTSSAFAQGTLTERLSLYEKAASKSLSAGASVFILTPNQHRSRFLTEELARTIGSDRVVELSTRFTTKKLLERWNHVVRSAQPLVVVGTPAFLSVPLSSLGQYILEGESDAYRSYTRPFLDARLALFANAKQLQVPVLIGGTYISAETYWYKATKRNRNTIDRLNFENDCEVVDMKKEQELSSDFLLFSEALKALIQETVKRGGRVFLFVARRGLFPSTVCSDCGALVECPHCGAGLVLHERANKPRFFMCHRCQFTHEADIVCQHCKSWRLTPLGVGVGRVYEELQKHFSNVMLVSRDETPTQAQVRKRITSFLETPGAVLVGTDSALEMLRGSQVDTVGVVSIDARLSLPNYAIEEEVLHTLLVLRSVVNRRCVIQTRAHSNPVFAAVEGVDLNEFRDAQLAQRERLSYPPYATLVVLSFRGTYAHVVSVSQKIELLFAETDIPIVTLPARKRGKTSYEGSTLLRLSTSLEFASNVRGILRTLPPEIEIKINPLHLW